MNLGRTIGLFFSLVSLFFIFGMAAWGYQISQTVDKEAAERFERQHSDILISQATQGEHIKNIEAEMAEIRATRLSERMERLESASEANQKFLYAILVPLCFLVLDKLFFYMRKNRS